MTDAAHAFLDAWAMGEDRHPPLSDADAATLGARWEDDARKNGITAADLRAAAGGDIAAFLQRTFGRAGSELDLG